MKIAENSSHSEGFCQIVAISFYHNAKKIHCYFIRILQKYLRGPNRSQEAVSTAADDDLIRVETCTDPRGANRSEEAASTAADDDLIKGALMQIWKSLLCSSSCENNTLKISHS